MLHKIRKKQTLNVQTGVKITANSVLSTFPPSFISEERSTAELITSVALQGGSKHSLSDLEAGTEQSPASHQSWQACSAVWPLLMVGERREEEEGVGGWRRKDAARRPKGH